MLNYNIMFTFNFQTIVLLIASIILILMLVGIGISLSYKKNSPNWPPVISECPDYWEDLEGNGKSCYNKHSLGKCNIPVTDGSPNTMDFSVAPFEGPGGLCAKYNWANNCGVVWDGINSGTKNPCQKQG